MRSILKLTQDEFCESINISVPSLYNYENAKVPIPTDFALRACRRWFFDERWLATGKAPQRPGVDLMAHPVYLEIDGRLSFYELMSKISKLSIAYAELETTLSPIDRLDRLLKSVHKQPGRPKALLDWLYTHFTRKYTWSGGDELAETALVHMIALLRERQADVFPNGNEFGGPDASAKRTSGNPPE